MIKALKGKQIPFERGGNQKQITRNWRNNEEMRIRSKCWRFRKLYFKEGKPKQVREKFKGKPSEDISWALNLATLETRNWCASVGFDGEVKWATTQHPPPSPRVVLPLARGQRRHVRGGTWACSAPLSTPYDLSATRVARYRSPTFKAGAGGSRSTGMKDGQPTGSHIRVPWELSKGTFKMRFAVLWKKYFRWVRGTMIRSEKKNTRLSPVVCKSSLRFHVSLGSVCVKLVLAVCTKTRMGDRGTKCRGGIKSGNFSERKKPSAMFPPAPPPKQKWTLSSKGSQFSHLRRPTRILPPPKRNLTNREFMSHMLRESAKSDGQKDQKKREDRDPAATTSADPVPNKTGTRIPRPLSGDGALR